MAQNVTIGRIVRFRDTDGAEWPAIITVVHSDTMVSLQVFRQADITARVSVPLDGSTGNPVGGNFTWHWPERG
jgi:hypothetical protein